MQQESHVYGYRRESKDSFNFSLPLRLDILKRQKESQYHESSGLSS